MNKPASAPVPPRLLLVPVLCMAGIVVLSNFLVRFVINDWLTWAAFSYPVAFFVTDVCNRWAGPSLARRVALAGFATGVACSLLIPGESSARIAFGSGAGFLVSQLLDISVFNTLRRQSWWRAPFIGSALASAVDTVIFFSVAFGGSDLDWLPLAAGDYAVKLAMALVLLVPYRAVYTRLKTRLA